METLHSHPAEGGQQGEVKAECHVKAKPIRGQRCHCFTEEEVQVEEDQGNGKVDVDLHRDICTGLSVRQRTIDPCNLLNGVQV